MSVWRDSIRGLIEGVINKQFVVWIAATILLVFHIVSEDVWLYATGGFLAANVIGNRFQKEVIP